MMDSGLIGKIEKAKRYAEEKDRISITKFEAKITITSSLMKTVNGAVPVTISRGMVFAPIRWEWN